MPTTTARSAPRGIPASGTSGHGPPAAAPSSPLWRRHSDAVNERLLERWLPRDLDAVLKTDLYDEAIGRGLYEALSAHAARVAGIDLSEPVASAAAERNPGLEASVADIRRLPFGPGGFDAVISNSTLDHLCSEAEVEEALVEIARVTRPAGLLLITLDNPLNPLLALRNRLPVRLSTRLRQGFDFEPGWTCGPRRLRALLERAGFEVQAGTAVMHAPRAMVARMERGSTEAQERLVERLLAAERLEGLPTRYLTGHFVAALAARR